MRLQVVLCLLITRSIAGAHDTTIPRAADIKELLGQPPLILSRQGPLDHLPSDVALPPPIADLNAQMAALQAQHAAEMADLTERFAQLGAVASGADHALRDTLAIIDGYAALLDESPQPAEAARALQSIANATGEGRVILNRHQRLARLAVRKLDTRQEIDVAALFNRVALSMLHRFKNMKLRLEFHLPDPDLAAAGDPDALSQVAADLLENATKYNKKDGMILISIIKDPRQAGHLRISVTDTGIGIPADDLGRIQAGEERFRSRLSRKKGIYGAGRGLNIARRWLAEHGSQLEIDSVEGAGTTVSFSLPIWNEPSTAARP